MLACIQNITERDRINMGVDFDLLVHRQAIQFQCSQHQQNSTSVHCRYISKNKTIIYRKQIACHHS